MKKLNCADIANLGDLIIGMVVLIIMIAASVTGNSGIIVGFLLYPLAMCARKVLSVILGTKDTTKKEEAK